MSVYNGEKYLRESIESILNQTYRNFEFLIANDCSADSSEDIILEYKNKDKRIKYYKNQSNLGLTKTLNYLIRESESSYIARMDSDDIASLDRFEKQLEVFNKHKEIDIIFTNVTIIDDKSQHVCQSWRPDKTKDVLSIMKYHNYIVHPSVMVRKKVLDEVGLYNENYRTGQDHELWLRMIEKNKTFYYLNNNLLLYRINPSSVRANSGEVYYYKLAKVCLSNNRKKCALEYAKKLTGKPKFIVFLRAIIPFCIYRNIMYLFEAKNREKGLKK